MSQPWWIRDPEQLATELQLADQATDGRITRSASTGALFFEEDIVMDGVRYGLRLRFSDDHPYSPIRAFLAYPDLPNVSEIHRYTNGVLCLHADDEWNPSLTSLWVRNRAIAWINALHVFSCTGEWPNQ